VKARDFSRNSLPVMLRSSGGGTLRHGSGRGREAGENPWGYPLLALVLAGLSACFPLTPVECDAECEAGWLDGMQIRDTADLVSVRIPAPDSADLAMPVIIAAHGFTASTYEWEEFAIFAADSGVLVSRVLLGGHGTDIEDFQSSTWREWGKPVLDEYLALARMGYTRISLAGSSTGGTLILNHMKERRFDTIPPRQVFFIDPILSPGDKMLSVAGLFGGIVGNSPSSGTEEEKPHWYTNRPAEVLEQLYNLVNRVKNFLEDGFRAPAGTRVMVYKAKQDGAADPVGALLLYKGLRHSDGSRIGVEMLDSRKHVFTRLQGRSPGSVTAADSALQLRVFREMVGRVREQ
jgi:carboxylesterase